MMMAEQNRGNGGRWSTLADVPDTGVWPLAHPIPVADTISRIDAVIGDLDPSHSDTPTVVEELRSAQEDPASEEDLRAMQDAVDRAVAELAARTSIPPALLTHRRNDPVVPVEGRHPDGWGPCPDGCPCTACDPWEHPDPDFQGTDIVETDPPARGWLSRLLHRLNR